MTEYTQTEGNYRAAAESLIADPRMSAKIVELCDAINDHASGKSLTVAERAKILADDGSKPAADLLVALALVESLKTECGLSGPSNYTEAKSALTKFLRLIGPGEKSMGIVTADEIRAFETTVPKVRDNDFSSEVKARAKKK